MSPTAWERIEALFEEVLATPHNERAGFIERACADDPNLRGRLESLVAAHHALESGDARRPDFLADLDDGRAAAILEGADAAGAPPPTMGRYHVGDRIGEGGMGSVFLAHDPALDRRVALKLLPGHVSPDSDLSRRFVTEARAASMLDHPNIGTVYEIGESDDGRLFIAMAYYDGQTLRHRLADGPIPVDDVVAIARQVADGLAAAHGQGIVHRDIKPENLVFGADGRVRIVDFGVAKVAAATVTAGGVTPGTVAYMSPEQTRGETVDHRSDIWSLGVVLYEMLTGARPFDGDSNDTVLFRIRNDEPGPVCQRNAAVPAAIGEIVDRCLAKDPAGRFSSASEFHDALDAAIEPEGAPRHVPLWAWATGYLALAWPALLAAGAIGERLLLPEWVRIGAAVLLAVGLPVVLATAAGRERARSRSPVARRRVPWAGVLTWRRALAAGAFAFAALGLVAATVSVRGVPRVTGAHGAADALGERSWILLADFDAAEEDAVIAMAAREALAVDFQQSGFVNVLGRTQVAAVLQRMGLPDTTRVDLALALEIAERAGAGAVLTAGVARLGPQVILTGRAVRPGSGTELFAVRAAAAEDRLLGAVERLSREMRRRLGEERESIRRSRPLPEVTTGSLAALSLYAKAEHALAQQDDARAGELANEALRIDPGFAMAHRMAGIAANNQLMFGEARHHLDRAHELRHRLTEREQRHVEAAWEMGVALEPRRAADAYRLLLARYPDDLRATMNQGTLLTSWAEDFEAGYAAFRHAAELDPDVTVAVANAAGAAFLLGRADEADSLAVVAGERGAEGFAFRWRLARAFTDGDHRRVALACDSLLSGTAGVPTMPDDPELCGSMDVAAGRVRLGIARLEAVQRTYEEGRRYRNIAHVAQAMAVAHMLRGEPDLAAARVEAALDLIPDDAFTEPDRFINRTNLRLQAAILGRSDLMDRIAATYPPYPEAGHWFGRVGEALVDAALAVAEGDGATALATLEAGIPPGSRPAGWRIWDELLRGMAFELTGQPDSAANRYRRAAAPGRHVFPSMTKDRIYLPFALRRLAEVEADRGDRHAAADAYRRLLTLWTDADPEVHAEFDSVRATLLELDALDR